jgi:hypothetical protein
MMQEIFPPESWPSIKENKLKRYEYYGMLRNLKGDFLKATQDPRPAHTDFCAYVEETTGIRMHLEGSMITEHYTVVDDEKFFLFKLKH